jgi:hypothetical protein
MEHHLRGLRYMCRLAAAVTASWTVLVVTFIRADLDNTAKDVITFSGTRPGDSLQYLPYADRTCLWPNSQFRFSNSWPAGWTGG